jgi:hypothetical protein
MNEESIQQELASLDRHIRAIQRQNDQLFLIAQQLKATNTDLKAWAHSILHRLEGAGMDALHQEMDRKLTEILVSHTGWMQKLKSQDNGQP